MNAGEESNIGVIPAKPLNKTGRKDGGGEAEGRPVTLRFSAEENSMEPDTQPTQSGERVSQGLHGVRERARKNKQERFAALLHHASVGLLRDSFYGLKRKAAPGVDSMTWKAYETGLEDRLSDLHGRVHRGAYQAWPSKRKWIPKANGKLRPLGGAWRCQIFCVNAFSNLAAVRPLVR
jgi:RNA-directed DNA polymerase